MKKLIFTLLLLTSLSFAMAGADDLSYIFDAGIIKINGTDVCIQNTGVCLSNVSGGGGSGDITAVNAIAPYILGGGVSGSVDIDFNETYLNATINAIASSYGGNASWNETYADTLYLQSYTETDPLWTANQSLYSTTSDILALNYWNDTYATFNETYADTLYAPIGVTGDNASWNETYADTKYLQSYTETDPLWTANFTNVAFNNTVNQFAEKQFYDGGINITGTNQLKIGACYDEWNGTCLNTYCSGTLIQSIGCT